MTKIMPVPRNLILLSYQQRARLRLFYPMEKQFIRKKEHRKVESYHHFFLILF